MITIFRTIVSQSPIPPHIKGTQHEIELASVVWDTVTIGTTSLTRVVKGRHGATSEVPEKEEMFAILHSSPQTRMTTIYKLMMDYTHEELAMLREWGIPV